jgi:hypothetical protein
MTTEATLSTMTASERAAALNATTLAWVAEDPDHRGAGVLVEDQGYWTERGIHTGLDLERMLLASEISDSYKAIHGIRPRWIRTDLMTLAQLRAELDAIVSVPREAEAWEAEDDRYWGEVEARFEAEAAEAEAKAKSEAQIAKEDFVWALQDALEGFRVRA